MVNGAGLTSGSTVRLANPVTEILLQPGGSEATRLAPSKPVGRRSVHGS